jgi:tetratricopeptide (TPR) repeat protein
MQEDIDPQIGRRRIKARVLARRGEHEEAVRLAREAVELAERTDYLVAHANACLDLAEVLERAARPAEARDALAEALRLCERKQFTVWAERLRARLSA